MSIRVAICLFLTILAAFGQSLEWVAKSQAAKQAMAAGKFREAISLYQDLVRAFPDNPGLAMNLGLALHSASEYSAAIRQFQAVVKDQPQLAAAWFLLGVDLQKLNRPAEAVPALERALHLEPRDEVRLELADALLKFGRFSEAAIQFRTLAVSNPANTKAWLGLGLSYRYLSGQAFEKLQKSFDDSAYLYMLVGQSRADQHQYRSAYHYYRKALDLDPSLTEARQAIAAIYRKIGRPEWATVEEKKLSPLPRAQCSVSSPPCLFAEKRYEELLASAKNKASPEVYYWQAKAYSELAQQSREKLTQLPDSAEIHQLMAVLYDLRQLSRDAIQEWQRALAFQPDNINFKRKLAQSLSAMGDWPATAQIARELLKTEPDSVDIRFLLGDTLLKMQLPEEAAGYLKAVVSLEPKNLPANASLAQAYLQLGRSREAIPHLEAALPLDLDGSLRYQLAQAYRSAGQQDKVANVLAEYARIRKSSAERNAKLSAENEISPPSQ